MTRRSRASAARDAGALRFLLLLLGGWVVLRVMIVWNPNMPAIPDAAKAPWAPPAPFAAPERRDFSRSMPGGDVMRSAAMPALRREGRDRPAVASRSLPGESMDRNPPIASASLGAERHDLRFALMARLFPSSNAGALPASTSSWIGRSVPARAIPARGEPFWMQRSLAGWSLGGWLYIREGSHRAPDGIAAASQLGGSQAGMRLAYGLGDGGRLRAYGRATVAIEQPKQRELAFGIAFAPVRRWPVDFAVERRVAAGSEGRTALAAMMTGGVSEVPLPAGFRLDAYAQAGVVGARRRDGFADGAVVIDRRLGNDENAAFRLGALAAGAVQPGAARVDVGPRLTLRLPDVGHGSRISLDWRQRIAGDARPESGAALTLASDF